MMEGPASRNKVVEQLRMFPDISLQPPHACAHVWSQTYKLVYILPDVPIPIHSLLRGGPAQCKSVCLAGTSPAFHFQHHELYTFVRKKEKEGGRE